MSEEPRGFLGAIVLKAPTQGEVELLAHQMERFAAFDPPFRNKYEGGWVIKGTPYSEALPDATDIEDVELEQRMLVAKLAELEQRTESLTRDQERWKRDAEQSQAFIDLLTPDERLWLVSRRNGWPSPIGDSFGGVLPGKDTPPAPQPWELIYRYKDHGRSGQGWVCRRPFFDAELITEQHAQPAQAIEAAQRLQATIARYEEGNQQALAEHAALRLALKTLIDEVRHWHAGRASRNDLFEAEGRARLAFHSNALGAELLAEREQLSAIAEAARRVYRGESMHLLEELFDKEDEEDADDHG